MWRGTGRRPPGVVDGSRPDPEWVGETENEREVSQDSLSTVVGPSARLRRRLSLKSELTLAALPTVTVVVMLLITDQFDTRHLLLLFTALASSAFLIYLDPLHAMNNVRTLISSHTGAAGFGVAAWWLFGHSYPAAVVAMLVTIFFMIVFDVMHPPAASAALLFARSPDSQHQLIFFVLAVVIVALLVLPQRSGVWLFARLT